MKAIRIHSTGGPEVMQLEEIDLPAPKAGEVLIKQQQQASIMQTWHNVQERILHPRVHQ